jgi:tetratricopeptide (TPR) repeat protein
MQIFSNTRATLIHAVAVGAILFANTAARTDQNDPRLTDLFTELHDAPNTHAAESVEARIWQIWLEAPNTPAMQLLGRAQKAMEARDYYSARRILDRLIESEPNFSEAWNQRAIVMFLQDDFEASLGDIETTLELEPRHFGALAGRGQCYIQLERPQQAIDAFEAALEINPWLVSARLQIQMLRQHLKTRQNAI